MSIPAPSHELIERYAIPDLETHFVSLEFPDLGSLRRPDLDRVKAILQIAVAQTGHDDLNVALRAQRGGATLLGILVATNVQVQSQGGRLRLHSVSPQIQEILVRCGLKHLIASTQVAFSSPALSKVKP